MSLIKFWKLPCRAFLSWIFCDRLPGHLITERSLINHRLFRNICLELTLWKFHFLSTQRIILVQWLFKQLFKRVARWILEGQIPGVSFCLEASAVILVYSETLKPCSEDSAFSARVNCRDTVCGSAFTLVQTTTAVDVLGWGVGWIIHHCSRNHPPADPRPAQNPCQARWALEFWAMQMLGAQIYKLTLYTYQSYHALKKY